MKSVIIYESIHHSNTKKLVDAIANKYDVELVDATKVSEKDLNSYDLIGFASGIYAGSFHQSILNFASVNLPQDKKVFFMSSSAMNKAFDSSIKKAINNKNAEVLGNYHCSGYNTFGPFKLVGGTSKGHPDEMDIAGALEFYKVILEKCIFD